MGSAEIRKEIFKFGRGPDLQTGESPTDLWDGCMGEIESLTDIVFRALELSGNGIELVGSFDLEFIKEVQI